MRAILINRDGFRKCIEVARVTPLISIPKGFDTVSMCEYDPATVDISSYISEFRFIREYEDEFENHILIYKEL